MDDGLSKVVRDVNATRRAVDDRTAGEVPNQRLSTGSTPQFAGMRVTPRTAATLPAAGAAQDGLIYVDSTNNRLVYYVNGQRFYVAGTSF